jgi:hypothetical protein
MRLSNLAANLEASILSEALFKAGNLNEVRAILGKKADEIVSFLQSYDAGSFRTNDKTIATKLEANQFQVMLDSINSGYDAKRVWPDDVTGDAVSVAPLLVAQRSVTQVGKLTQSAMKDVSSGFQKKLEAKFGKGEYTAIVSNFGKGAGEFSYTLQVYYGPKFLKPFASALSKGLKGEAKNPSGTSAKTGGSVATPPPAPSTVPAQLIAPEGGGSPNALSESEKTAIYDAFNKETNDFKSSGLSRTKKDVQSPDDVVRWPFVGIKTRNDASLIGSGWTHIASRVIGISEDEYTGSKSRKKFPPDYGDDTPWSWEVLLKELPSDSIELLFGAKKYSDISKEIRDILRRSPYAAPKLAVDIQLSVYAKKVGGKISVKTVSNGFQVDTFAAGGDFRVLSDRSALEFAKSVIPAVVSEAEIGTPVGDAKFVNDLEKLVSNFNPSLSLAKKLSASADDIVRHAFDGKNNWYKGTWETLDKYQEKISSNRFSKESIPYASYSPTFGKLVRLLGKQDPPKKKKRVETWSLVYAPDGYADSVEAFDSYEDAAAEGQGQRRFYLVMGNQQWNEPVGQTDEEPNGGAYSEPA